ncbi:MAG: UDP-glucose 4-epimerase GalE, partial [Spirochaetaceae bacterium]|nr:UDP-glucose 4-epimerase GalE [Spirochaetaceae bacterium]
MDILVTGGAGYIGSHTCLLLLEAGHKVIVVDNLSNSSEESLRRVKKLTGKELLFYHIDLLDKRALEVVFKENHIDSVIHFAGLKAVGESVTMPLHYYHNNLTGTFNLCSLMNQYHVKNIVFSSSATVYGEPEMIPITEEARLQATNPYGRTKLMLEEILKDFYVADNTLNVALLRYFNPIGAHQSGEIGEDPNGIPNNLLPFVAQVAVGKREKVGVFGNDYNTPDGTGVRDYIHVMDLAAGHLKALEKLNSKPGVVIYNLGTGKGYSVLEVISAFSKAAGKEIPYEIKPRRSGDIATCYAEPKFAEKELGWKAERNMDDMCRDAWRWQSQNPEGYGV